MPAHKSPSSARAKNSGRSRKATTDSPRTPHKRSGSFSDRPRKDSGGYGAERSTERSSDRSNDRSSSRGGSERGGDKRFDRGNPRGAKRFDSRPTRSTDGRDRQKPSTPRSNAVVDAVLQKYPATVITPETPGVDRFQDLGVSDALAEVLAQMGATSPFPIQSATIPESLTGRDVLARGHTGSGKTIAFGAALVTRLAGKKSPGRREFGRAPSALILAPTRELALQIDRTVQPLARAAGLFTTQIVGGVPQGRQVGALRRGVDIVIGTPGRIEDLISQRALDLSAVRITVVDEADHMAELGFLEPLQRLLRATQEGGQKLFFSATLDRQVASLVDEFLVTPAVFELQDASADNQSIDHHVFVINQKDKADVVRRLAAHPGKTLVFTRTRAFAETLSDYLDDEGVPSVSLHGDLNQSRRQRNLQKLTDGRVNVLVATDVAARGIHVNDIDLVIHADQPEEHKTYIHRSGRTGRAGATGTVVTLTTKGRHGQVDRMLEKAGVVATSTQQVSAASFDNAKNPLLARS